MNTRNILGYSLTDGDVYKLAKGINIITYKDLYNYRSIEQLLNNEIRAVIILYEMKKGSGHWTLLFQLTPGIIEFFDSYGEEIDDELQYVDPKYKKELGENKRYLSELVLDSPYDLEYNPFRFQKLKKGISTCGRWVILRLLFRDYSVEEFHSAIMAVAKHLKITPDELVLRAIKVK